MAVTSKDGDCVEKIDLGYALVLLLMSIGVGGKQGGFSSEN